MQVILDPGVTDPKSTQDKPGVGYEIVAAGQADGDCDSISWDNSTGTLKPGFPPVWNMETLEGYNEDPATVIRKVHMVFMNHLDAGYAIHLYQGNPYGFVSNVLNTYQREYMPRAIALQKTLRAMGRKENYIYTTHPWLVSLYLDCPPNMMMANGSQLFCPSGKERADFEAAVRRGDITWHHGPFNMEPENMMTPFLFEAGNNISADLDARYGFAPKFKTFSHRDVPSMTRAVIPLLKKQGFSAISVGQNDGTPPVFYGAKIWKDLESFRVLLVGLNDSK